jgi:hypothetical protein
VFAFSIMENDIHLVSVQQDSPEVPSLIKHISSNDVVGFDDTKLTSFRKDQCQPSEPESSSPSTGVSFSSNPMLFDAVWRSEKLNLYTLEFMHHSSINPIKLLRIIDKTEE